MSTKNSYNCPSYLFFNYYYFVMVTAKKSQKSIDAFNDESSQIKLFFGHPCNPVPHTMQ